MIKATDLFKPASPEEVAKRRAAYPEILLMDYVASLPKTKLSDGTWHVHSKLYISYNYILTLKNLNVSIVDDDFSCGFTKITSLEGAPKRINGYFCCGNNRLSTLDGAPKIVLGDFWCRKCNYLDKQFTEDEVRAVCDVKGRIIV